ncbi:hypothetical protein BJ322DRAFT_1102586 [Thelephora terrestris]|uniref:Uncharacterized protein n=1 Tax=Thelephora terrestris TaxID=56493 RepID=A0A9P6HQK1_9AGAM|nr:hypothetical protein BJ322DRAFT_1102586 [Thelephora terrestris]
MAKITTMAEWKPSFERGISNFRLGKYAEALTWFDESITKGGPASQLFASRAAVHGRFEASKFKAARLEDSAGRGSQTIGACFISFLFALMANAPNTGYRLIEIDQAVASWKQQNPRQNIEDHLHEFASTTILPLLTSTIQETLRYAASVMSIRRVTEPVEFGGYRFDTDDEIVCMTRSVHLDEEIHENASEYDPRRYLSLSIPQARHQESN